MSGGSLPNLKKEASNMAHTLTTKEEQLRLIEECRASGLTDTEWCLQHGIRPKTFYTWIYMITSKVVHTAPGGKRKAISAVLPNASPYYYKTIHTLVLCRLHI